MVAYGQLSPITQGLLQFYYGGIWLAAVYRLWFTRERSKVRSLVRPPEASMKSDAFDNGGRGRRQLVVIGVIAVSGVLRGPLKIAVRSQEVRPPQWAASFMVVDSVAAGAMRA